MIILKFALDLYFELIYNPFCDFCEVTVLTLPFFKISSQLFQPHLLNNVSFPWWFKNTNFIYLQNLHLLICLFPFFFFLVGG